MSRVALRSGIVLALAIMAAGCSKKDESPATTAESKPATTGSAAAAAPADSAAAPIGSGDAAKALGALGDMMNAAANAKGDTPCDQAYNAMEAMMQAAEKAAPAGATKTDKKLPPKDDFVKVCKELPEDVQKCMNFGYAMEHLKDCEAAQAKLDPAMKEKFKNLAPK
jgi:hypothetical protein